MSCNRYPLRPGTTIPWQLRAGVQALNWETRLLFGTPIKDILSGMWALRSETRRNLSITAGDWNFSPAIKVQAMRSDAIRFGEFSIVQRRRLGTSHQRYLSTGLSHAAFLVKARLGIYPGSGLDGAR